MPRPCFGPQNAALPLPCVSTRCLAMPRPCFAPQNAALPRPFRAALTMPALRLASLCPRGSQPCQHTDTPCRRHTPLGLANALLRSALALPGTAVATHRLASPSRHFTKLSLRTTPPCHGLASRHNAQPPQRSTEPRLAFAFAVPCSPEPGPRLTVLCQCAAIPCRSVSLPSFAWADRNSASPSHRFATPRRA
jgi:hypothetical protein